MIYGILFVFVQAKAQQGFHDNIVANFQYGKTLDHHGNFNFDLPKPAMIECFKYEQQTSGKKYWHQAHHLPSVNYALLHASIGNELQAGQAFGAVVGLNFFTKNRKWIFTVNTGAAYITKPFHIVENNMNNALGSHVNNCTQFGLAYNFRVYEHWNLRPSFVFTHFSNGRFAFPNQGYNMPSIGVQLAYSVKKRAIINPKWDLDSIPQRRNPYLSASFGVGFTERKTAGGPRYSVFNARLMANKPITRNMNIYLCNTTQLDMSDWAILNEKTETNSVGKWNALRSGMYVGTELFFGKLSWRGQLGLDLIQNELKRGKPIIEIGLRKYFDDTYVEKNKNLFIEIHLETVLVYAQQVGITVGYNF